VNLPRNTRLRMRTGRKNREKPRPIRAVDGKSAGRHDAVDMGMVLQVLTSQPISRVSSRSDRSISISLSSSIRFAAFFAVFLRNTVVDSKSGLLRFPAGRPGPFGAFTGASTDTAAAVTAGAAWNGEG
jgi:hypothetical protein